MLPPFFGACLLALPSLKNRPAFKPTQHSQTLTEAGSAVRECHERLDRTTKEEKIEGKKA